MAWRPNENLIEGELDNRTSGKVKGWMRFFRGGEEPLRVTLDLVGDFHEDIRGKVIRFKNSVSAERNAELERDGTYMDGFEALQCGEVGDITAGHTLGPWTESLAQRLMEQHESTWEEKNVPGKEREGWRREVARQFREHIDAGDLFFPYVSYPYIEWYSEANGRVVPELDASQVEVLDGIIPHKEKTSAELSADEQKRKKAMATYLERMVRGISQSNREEGGDGAVIGAVIG